MSKLSHSAKEAIIKKALSNCGTMREIAQNHSIGYSTLCEWVRRYRDGESITRSDKQGMQPLSERFEHLLATASLSGDEVSRYCRENGLYAFQLTKWKEDFMTERASTDKATQTVVKALQTENKTLKQEILRKDKALAEATALLILKKKASLIWGEVEDD